MISVPLAGDVADHPATGGARECVEQLVREIRSGTSGKAASRCTPAISQ